MISVSGKKWIENKVNKNSIEIRDPIGEYKNPGTNYADFKIGYFDILLTYKF